MQQTTAVISTAPDTLYNQGVVDTQSPMLLVWSVATLCLPATPNYQNRLRIPKNHVPKPTLALAALAYLEKYCKPKKNKVGGGAFQEFCPTFHLFEAFPLSQASQQRGPAGRPAHGALPLQQPLQRRRHARAPQGATEAALVATSMEVPMIKDGLCW